MLAGRRNTVLGNALIALGVGLFACGVFVRLLEARSADTTPKQLTQTPATSEENLREENRKKGEDFEKWVVSKFDNRYFRVLEWRGDKQTHGHYAESSRLPDLEMEFKLHGEASVFAVECKWRKSFYREGVEWTYPTQLEGYRSYAKQRQRPVFVVIGVGGTASDPNQVFVIPLVDLSETLIPKLKLMAYRRNNTNRNFFFDESTSTLR